jgi:DNA-binding NarL/FixJ family response regulator
VAGASAAWLRGASGGDAFTVWYGTLTSGFIVATIRRLFAAIRQLRQTREELATVAVSEERLRFARDLHDLLGHTLSVMPDIAGRLHLSESTVRNYLSAAIGKTAARNRIEAVRAARRNGWV